MNLILCIHRNCNLKAKQAKDGLENRHWREYCVENWLDERQGTSFSHAMHAAIAQAEKIGCVDGASSCIQSRSHILNDDASGGRANSNYVLRPRRGGAAACCRGWLRGTRPC